MPKHFFKALALLCLWPVSLEAQYQIIKLSGRTTAASYYEQRGDFILYKKPDLCKAVIYRCENEDVAESVRLLLEQDSSLSARQVKDRISSPEGLTTEEGKFRRWSERAISDEFWQTGLSPSVVADGKVVFAHITEIYSETRIHKLNKFDLFSVMHRNGNEDVLYDPDTTDSGDPSELQVRQYIMGEQYGMAEYHKPIHGPAGAAVGLASVFALGFYAPPVIFAYALAISQHNPRHIPPSPVIDEETFNSEFFRNGYHKYARNKKARQSLIWGGIGFVVGFPVFLVIFHE